MAVIQAAEDASKKLTEFGGDVWGAMTPTGLLVDKATANTDEPIPGYVYNELAQFTFKSVTSCQKLQDNLLRRLKKKNPVTKLKCLRVLKYVCQKGHSSFRKDLQRRTEPISLCLQWRGTPDPLRGDVLNQMIRDEAQELLNLIYLDIGDSSSSSSSSSSPSEIGRAH